MRVKVVVVVCLWLAGCATSGNGLMRGKVVREYQSAKAPDQLSGCVALALIGTNPAIRESDDHYVVMRNNGYGVPVVRYDFYRTPTGSRVELRRSMSINSGTGKVEDCL